MRQDSESTQRKDGFSKAWALSSGASSRSVVLWGGLTLLGAGALRLLGGHNYLLFHSLAELLSVAIAITIFSIGWNVRRFSQNNLLWVVAVSSASVAGLDALHMLAYPGLGLLEDPRGNFAPQFWLAARLIESSAFVLGALWLGRKAPRASFLLGSYLGAGVVLLLLVYPLGLFPLCWEPRTGVTWFKACCEGVVSLGFALAVGLLYRKRRCLEPQVTGLLAVALGVRILAELTLTNYVQRYGTANIWGHVLKVLSNCFVYAALISGSLKKPYEMMFRDLAQSEDRLKKELAERRRAEAALQEAKEQAEGANRAKSEFLANMSHELRTPLNAILGMTELVLTSPLSAEQKEFLSMSKASANSLLGIINGILDFSKIEAGKFELDEAPFDVSDVVQAACDALALAAHQKGLELVGWVQPGLASPLVGDAARLRQVLLNLVGNAVKFTEKGEVVLTVRSDSYCRDPSRCSLTFSVRDTGPGIAPEKQDRLFRPFSQLDGTITRKYGGTGLGLVISKQFVAKMGGSIYLHSQESVGSTFSFNISLPIAPHEPAPSSPLPELLGCTVLVVDDNRTQRLYLQELLAHAGLVVAAVESGQAALEAVQAAKANGHSYRLVLLDSQMPGLDGFSTAEKLHQLFGHERIILMTPALAAEPPPEQMRELGIAAHVLKPIRPAVLLTALCQALSSQRCLAPNAPLEPVPNLPTKPRGIALLVEDSTVNQRLVCVVLGRRGWQVGAVSDGAAAVQAFQSQRFDVVLMDVQMPQMDGLEATRRIRQWEASQGAQAVPIVGLTAYAMKGDKEKCLQAGMDEYLTKPLDLDLLCATLDRLCPESALPRAAGPGEPEPMSAIRSPAIELSKFLDMINHDPEVLQEVLSSYLADSPSKLEQLRQAVEKGQAQAIESLAHSIKGTVSLFGAAQARAYALELEQLGRAGVLEPAPEVLMHLQAALLQVQEALGAVLDSVLLPTARSSAVRPSPADSTTSPGA